MTAEPAATPSDAAEHRSSSQAAERGANSAYARGTRVLSIGIASTGLLTFAYFSLASHLLGEDQASRVDLLWSVMFVVISVIYRPIEQLLSRSIAEQRALGHSRHSLKGAVTLQVGFAAIFALLALLLRATITEKLFAGSEALFWVLFLGTLAYAASYFARGWLAGQERFAHYGALVFIEAFSRLCFPLAVATGLLAGERAVAYGIAAAPLLSMAVLPGTIWRAQRNADPPTAPAGEQPRPPGAAAQPPAASAQVPAAALSPATPSLGAGARFAGSVSAIMISEQALLNAAVLTTAATSTNHQLPGIVFNVLLISRAPLQLFQSVQTALLPHLTGLRARAGHDDFARAIAVTVRLSALFALGAALLLLLAGPALMEHALFGQRFAYPAAGLALVGLGMGAHLIAGTFNQAALARAKAHQAAACWLAVALAFVIWMLLPIIPGELLRCEVGYAGATGLLAALLGILYRRSRPIPGLAS